jgi:ABC-type amino acid transport system permease subunit
MIAMKITRDDITSIVLACIIGALIAWAAAGTKMISASISSPLPVEFFRNMLVILLVVYMVVATSLGIATARERVVPRKITTGEK